MWIGVLAVCLVVACGGDDDGDGAAADAGASDAAAPPDAAPAFPRQTGWGIALNFKTIESECGLNPPTTRDVYHVVDPLGDGTFFLQDIEQTTLTQCARSGAEFTCEAYERRDPVPGAEIVSAITIVVSLSSDSEGLFDISLASTCEAAAGCPFATCASSLQGVGKAMEQVAATAIDCADEATTSTANSDEQTLLDFVNDSGESVRVYWLDFTGERVFMFDLLPDRTVTQPTFVTHPFLVTDMDDNCLGIFGPSRDWATATVQ